MYVLDIYNRNLKELARYINPTIVFTTQKFFAKVMVVFEVFRNFGVFSDLFLLVWVNQTYRVEKMCYQAFQRYQ